MTTSVMHTKEKADTSAGVWAGRNHDKAFSRLGGGRRRSVPHLLVGVLLVVACAGGGVLAVTQWDDRESVLILARPVVVGQVLTAQHLTELSITVDSGLELVPASAVSTVVGTPAAFNLPKGSLVTRPMLGAPRTPPQGEAIAALGLKPGQFPPDLSPGATVVVLATPTPRVGTGDAETSSWRAVVTGLATGATDQSTVVSLQLAEADAKAMSSAPAGQLNLVTIAGGER